jgi:hypothetical protein
LRRHARIVSSSVIAKRFGGTRTSVKRSGRLDFKSPVSAISPSRQDEGSVAFAPRLMAASILTFRQLGDPILQAEWSGSPPTSHAAH